MKNMLLLATLILGSSQTYCAANDDYGNNLEQAFAKNGGSQFSNSMKKHVNTIMNLPAECLELTPQQLAEHPQIKGSQDVESALKFFQGGNKKKKMSMLEKTYNPAAMALFNTALDKLIQAATVAPSPERDRERVISDLARATEAVKESLHRQKIADNTLAELEAKRQQAEESFKQKKAAIQAQVEAELQVQREKYFETFSESAKKHFCIALHGKRTIACLPTKDILEEIDYIEGFFLTEPSFLQQIAQEPSGLYSTIESRLPTFVQELRDEAAQRAAAAPSKTS